MFRVIAESTVDAFKKTTGRPMKEQVGAAHEVISKESSTTLKVTDTVIGVITGGLFFVSVLGIVNFGTGGQYILFGIACVELSPTILKFLHIVLTYITKYVSHYFPKWEQKAEEVLKEKTNSLTPPEIGEIKA